MSTSSWRDRFGLGAVLLVTAVLVAPLSGCSNEAKPDKLPEVAKVEPKKGEVKLEEKIPLTPDDVGDPVLATGTVIGAPLPNGFFLLTAGNQVIFVETTKKVKPADHVRVVGPLGVAAVGTFDGYKRDALTNVPVADYDVLETWLIKATTVDDI